ncbi:metallophosphoesterase [Agrobacterium fabrum]|uniref:metallophosphoesterase n=1 Tax=Agrobacterium fabrum TaxID=1176649 RepID=UPI003B9FC777
MTEFTTPTAGQAIDLAGSAVLLLGDSHLVAGDVQLYGQDPARRLRDTISVVEDDHPGMAAAFFIGDLAHNGHDDEYGVARSLLDGLHAPSFVVAGNHDNRDLLEKYFPVSDRMQGPFRQYDVVVGATRFIVLDTVGDGTSSGEICEERLRWLESVLAKSDRKCVILMHHPPLPLGFNVDAIRLRQSSELLQVFGRHRMKIELVVFGHTHRSACGTWEGFPFVALKATGHQRIAAQKGRPDSSIDHGVPSFALLRITRGSVVVQLRDISVDRAP